MLAKETLEIIERGYYTTSAGNKVDIAKSVEVAIEGTCLYRPEDFPNDIVEGGPGTEETAIEVTSETTLAAAQRLFESSGESDLLCLNFASAKNPGGGFLSGSQAQEESLARSSCLYPCLMSKRELYDHNRKLETCLYSDYMIYSPSVPVFRDDEGNLLDPPFRVSFITAPAVNAGAVQRNEPRKVDLIRPMMLRRLQRLLWVALENEQSRLILGAWGCGVFGNDPTMIAEIFAEALDQNGSFYNRFKHIVFAVYDSAEKQENFKPFQRIFAK